LFSSLIDITSDGHVHTRLCRHAIGEMEDYVKAAIDRGLGELVFLEHFEAGINCPDQSWLDPADFAYYWQEGARLKSLYNGRIRVGIGVEIGYNPNEIAVINEMIDSYPWDRVGLSYHFLDLDGDHRNMLSRRQLNLSPLIALGVEQVIDLYLAGINQAIDEIPAQVVCHLDAVLRHVPYLAFSQSHQLMFADILVKIKEQGMALEINTSGYPIRGEAFPMSGIIARVIELGIPMVAGSDAHRPEDVGRFFQNLPDLLNPVNS